MDKSLPTLCTLVVLAGCAPEAWQTSQRIRVNVVSDPGVPLAAAELHAGTHRLARSDHNGTMEVELPGKPGDVAKLGLSCPPGYRAQESELSVLLREPQAQERPPEFSLACPPLTRTLVVAVRADRGANLPLRYLGEELARTDASGVTHALVQAKPGDALTLTLDTSAEPQLMPQHPELKLSVPDHDDLVVFDQAFKRPKEKRKPVPPKPPEPTGPERF
jgi:hypothetical protein